MLELRAMKDGQIRQQWFTSIDDFLAGAEKFEEGWNLYFGVATRFGEASTKGDCYRVRCIWLDLDKLKLPTFEVFPSPSIVVKSGHGWHIYWVFNESVVVRDKKWLEVEATNRYLCDKFGGDVGSIDITRILRIPGTFNYKGDKPKKVEAFEYEDLSIQ